jgi:hypothetical protein
MLPPFAIQSEETRAMAKDCSIGIEPRISAERFILLDTQVLSSNHDNFIAQKVFFFLLICLFIVCIYSLYSVLLL